MSGAGIPWSKQDDARLAVLWAEGHRTRALAVAFGRSRNGIIGRVHRLHLPSRPSPIPGHATAIRETRVEPAKRELHDVAPPVRVPLPPPPERVPAWGCAWLEGERPDWLRCDAPVWGNTSWCREHYRRCYQRWPLQVAA